MYSKDNASSLSLLVKPLYNGRPNRPLFAALTALTATLTVALTALAPAPAAAQAGAFAYSEKTDYLVTAQPQNFFGVTLFDLVGAAGTTVPPDSAFIQYVDGAFLPPDSSQDAYAYAFAGPNIGLAAESSALSAPFDALGGTGQGSNVTHYSYALAPAAGYAYGSPLTTTYLFGDAVPLTDDGSGDFKPDAFLLFQDDFNQLESATTKPTDFAFSSVYNTVDYEYDTPDGSASYGGTTLYASLAETVNNATFTSTSEAAYLTAQAGGLS